MLMRCDKFLLAMKNLLLESKLNPSEFYFPLAAASYARNDKIPSACFTRSHPVAVELCTLTSLVSFPALRF